MVRWKECVNAIHLAKGSFTNDFVREMMELNDLLEPSVPSPKEIVKGILETYPLLQTADDRLDALRSEFGKHWVGYIKLMDGAAACSGEAAVA
jgi:hypothetical protein